jgi:aspartokinase
MFSVLAGESVNIDMISSTEMNITCVVSLIDSVRAVKALERAFP